MTQSFKTNPAQGTDLNRLAGSLGIKLNRIGLVLDATTTIWNVTHAPPSMSAASFSVHLKGGGTAEVRAAGTDSVKRVKLGNMGLSQKNAATIAVAIAKLAMHV